MALIKDIIANINGPEKIERIVYNYKSDIAGKVWKEIACQYIHDPQINKDCKDAWNNILRYVFADSRCKYDLTKGIGLIGMTGSGKTMTMHILNDFINIDGIQYKKGEHKVKMRFKMESALVIASKYQTEGYNAVNKYSSFANLCIDDLGAENTEKRHYGDSINVIQEIIENRYTNNLLTHFTSNLDLEDIRELYGDRVYSRLHDACNIVVMNDADYRVINSK